METFTQIKNPDLVSVIVPCYNQAQYLREALESIYSQTHLNWECIIVNDGSTDHTESTALEWCKKDNRFKYLKKDNGGLSSARNAGLEAASGNYIQFLDADDIIDKRKFSESLKYLDDNDLVITDFLECRETISNIVPPFCRLNVVAFNYQNILLEWDKSFCIPIHCGVFKKKLFENFKFMEGLKAKEDWLMWLKIFKKVPRVKFISEPLAVYRIQTGSMTREPSIMNDNTYRVFQIIMENEEDERLRLLFFNKVNEYWNHKLKGAQHKLEKTENSLNTILKSKKYQLFQKCISPFNFLEKIFNR